MRYKTSGLVCVIAGAATAIGLTFTPLAHADESSFLYDVARRGVPALPVTLAVGHQVCTDVSLNGTAGFDREAAQAISAGVSTHDASVIIVVAVFDLCPSNMPALNAYLYDTEEA